MGWSRGWERSRDWGHSAGAAPAPLGTEVPGPAARPGVPASVPLCWGQPCPVAAQGGSPKVGALPGDIPQHLNPIPGVSPNRGGGNLSTREGAPKALRTAGGTQNCPGGNPQSKGDPKATLEEPPKQGSSKAILEEPPEQGGFQSHPMGNYRSGCTAGGVPQIYPEGNPQSKHTAGWGS